MNSKINPIIIICLITCVSVSFAQEAVETPAANADSNEVYVGEIVGDNVNIRSGPGTNYYVCTKLNKADRVKVVGSQFSWTRIEPPAGCFSWISKHYVSADPANPGIGIVTGDSVRVYAGSTTKQPIHSTRLQGKLSKNDMVKLLGDVQEDYYKIAPPVFAYLWVSTKYVKQIGNVEDVPLIVESSKTVMEPVAPAPDVVSQLKVFRSLQKSIDAEKKKPLDKQNYTDIKNALIEIANDSQADKAARYAKFTVKQVEGYELAGEVDKAVKLQAQQLLETIERIEKARATKLEQLPDLGDFAAVGNFQVSSIYGSEPELRHYQLIDEDGKIICFALPDESASDMNLDEFLDEKVGLLGRVTPHPQTAGALVKFTKVVELD